MVLLVVQRVEVRRVRRPFIFTNEFTAVNNNNNNKHDNVYGAVIMAEPLREFTRFI